MTGTVAAMRRALERWMSPDGDPRWTPLVLWLAGLGLIGVGLSNVWTSVGWVKIDPWWHAVPLTVGCLAIAVSRRHPMIALSVGTVTMLADFAIGGSLGVLLVIFDLLFTAFRYGRPRARRVISVLVALTIFGVGILFWSLMELRTGIAIALQLTLFFVVPLWWARDLRMKEELARLAAERVELERQRADDLIRVGELDRQRAVQAERAAMARDLHDVIASHLSATALQAGAALARPADADGDRKALESVRESSLAGLAEMRSMIMLLRNELDPDSEPVAAPPRLDRVSELVKQAQDNGLRIRFGGDAATVPAAVDQTAYRIIAEALVNAAKHAPGSTVELTIDGADPLVVRVENTAGSGAAIHPALSAGHGLDALRDRTAALGGRLSAGPTDHGTWLIEAIIPGGDRVRS
ncbi:sensor histidine kinase [Microlunatus sp. GCM10028923]|uniref:sensor histidine kinase n=1 Tax=Microlunatus sp. GCM10028923 TaxID=3273400 RepID=UPI00360CF8EA